MVSKEGRLPSAQLHFRLLNCIMILSSSTIKEQRHHAERAIWNTAYDFKKEKRDQPERDGGENPKKKHNRVVKIAVLVGILVIAAGLLVGYLVKHREPTFQQIGARYTDDPDWGNVYEISYVVKGKVTAKKLNDYLDVVRNEVDREELGTNIVKVSYYRNKEDALAWKETDMRGYTFLDVE